MIHQAVCTNKKHQHFKKRRDNTTCTNPLKKTLKRRNVWEKLVFSKVINFYPTSDEWQALLGNIKQTTTIEIQ